MTRSLRRVAGLSVAVVLAAILTPSTASAATPAIATVPAASVPAASIPGLYGQQDPTYTAVYRQSMAIIALRAAKRPVPSAARAWLVAQQCADGSFQAWRADTSAPCAVADPVAFSGPDTNSTALAAVALQRIGEGARARRALAWLRGVQNPDGGFPYIRGGASDSNSTGLVLIALRSAGLLPDVARGRGRAVSAYLASVVQGCAAPLPQRGGVAYQPGAQVTANDLASVQVLAGLAPVPFQRRTQVDAAAGLSCPGRLPRSVAHVRTAIAGHVSARVIAGSGVLPSWDDSADLNATAWAVIALGSSGKGRTATRAAIVALRSSASSWAVPGGVPDANRLSVLLLAARAHGADPRAFGGVDLVRALESSLG